MSKKSLLNKMQEGLNDLGWKCEVKRMNTLKAFHLHYNKNGLKKEAYSFWFKKKKRNLEISGMARERPKEEYKHDRKNIKDIYLKIEEIAKQNKLKSISIQVEENKDRNFLKKSNYIFNGYYWKKEFLN